MFERTVDDTHLYSCPLDQFDNKSQSAGLDNSLEDFGIIDVQGGASLTTHSETAVNEAPRDSPRSETCPTGETYRWPSGKEKAKTSERFLSRF